MLDEAIKQITQDQYGRPLVYQIVLVLTDGALTESEVGGSLACAAYCVCRSVVFSLLITGVCASHQLMESRIDQIADMPMSLIIVGIGGADFSTMKVRRRCWKLLSQSSLTSYAPVVPTVPVQPRLGVFGEVPGRQEKKKNGRKKKGSKGR